MQPISSPLLPNAKGQEVANLQQGILFLLKKGIFKTFNAPNTPTAEDIKKLTQLLQTELRTTVYGNATIELVRIFQIQQQLSDTLKGMVEETTAKKLNELLRGLGALDNTDNSNDTDSEDNKPYVVSGILYNNNGAPLPGYIAEAFIIAIERAVSVGKATTGKNGEYQVDFANTVVQGDPDIEIRAYKKGDEKNFARSAVKYNASAKETLDVIFAADKITTSSEFNLILADVDSHLGGLKINDLKENDTTRHITYLSNKTGWDTRVTAMLASAHKLGDTLKINPSHIYALLRAGIPATEEAIKSVSVQKAEAAISNAVKKNIIPAAGNIKETAKALETLSVNYMLTSKPLSSVSTLDEMLGIRLNNDQKAIFAQTQKQLGNDKDKLWKTLEQKGFKPDAISNLKLDGKLGYLTGQNAALVKKVYGKFNIKTDVELVSSGLYKASEWKNMIGNEIPAGITADEYATHLANKVKLSYPTAVAGEMIKRKEIRFGDNAPADELAAFFSANQSKNNIGAQPIKTWEGFNQLSTPAKVSAKSLERMYQISPSDESMVALGQAGLYSAYQIAKSSKTEFLTAHGSAFPSIQEAEMTYIKANEVYSAS
ncbi:MAG TPA: hypothetical protein VFV68_00915, partial [Agriterribacter sp.]|nr:hypothetical protein [Agriterribacter sp.]